MNYISIKKNQSLILGLEVRFVAFLSPVFGSMHTMSSHHEKLYSLLTEKAHSQGCEGGLKLAHTLLSNLCSLTWCSPSAEEEAPFYHFVIQLLGGD